jgi:hypothetical protein
MLAVLIVFSLPLAQTTTLTAARGPSDTIRIASPAMDGQAFFLEVTIPPETLLNAPASQHTFSQIQLNNMVRSFVLSLVPRCMTDQREEMNVLD